MSSGAEGREVFALQSRENDFRLSGYIATRVQILGLLARQ